MKAHAILRAALCASLALLFAGCPSTHAPEAGDPAKVAALEHWRSLEPEQQGELERRYDSLQELSDAELAELVAKKRLLDAELERVHAQLGDADRALLEPLPAHARRAVLRELLLAERRERGLLRRADVPADFVRELEGAPPHDRGRRFCELRDRLRKEAPEQALRRLGEKLGRGEADIERALQAEPPQRLATLRAWRREQFTRDVERRGLPPFLDRAQWDELSKLDDHAFWRELDSRRPREPWCEGQPRGGRDRRDAREPGDAREPRDARELHDGREPREGREPRDGRESRSGWEPREPRDGRGGPPHRGGAPRPPDAGFDGPPLRPTLQDLLELRELPQQQRREAIGERVRTRALEWFEQRRALDAAQLDELRSLHGEAFFERLRALLREARKPV